jgi:hypothetical protein
MEIGDVFGLVGPNGDVRFQLEVLEIPESNSLRCALVENSPVAEADAASNKDALGALAGQNSVMIRADQQQIERLQEILHQATAENAAIPLVDITATRDMERSLADVQTPFDTGRPETSTAESKLAATTGGPRQRSVKTPQETAPPSSLPDLADKPDLHLGTALAKEAETGKSGAVPGAAGEGSEKQNMERAAGLAAQTSAQPKLANYKIESLQENNSPSRSTPEKVKDLITREPQRPFLTDSKLKLQKRRVEVLLRLREDPGPSPPDH